MNIAEKLAEFTVDLDYEKIPEEVLEISKKSILDNFAIILGAGGAGEGCGEMINIALHEGGSREEAGIIGFDKKISACWAAFANGSMSHSLDFGDAYEKGTIHPTASTFVAALAAAEADGAVDGRRFLTAMAAGCETACRISYGITEDLAKYGWYMPPIITSFGATAAVGKIMGLTREELVAAFSFNLCQTTCSSKILTDPDSAMRSVREAFAAKNAIISCYMAKRGLKGFADPFGGERGFYEAYGRSSTDVERAARDLGKSFEMAELSFKIWPCCRGTHAPIDGCLKMKKRYDISPEDILSIHMKVDSMNEMLFIPSEEKCAPQNRISAKFSIPFTVAAALLQDGVSLETFNEENLRNREIQNLAEKVTYEIFPERAPIKAIVNIKTSKGEYETTAVNPPGASENPVSYDQIADKFHICAQLSPKKISRETRKKVIEAISSLEKIENINRISRLL